MDSKEKQRAKEALSGMIGQKYVYDNKDVVTVQGITLDGDRVIFITDLWDDEFDISGFEEWIKLFVASRDESKMTVMQGKIASLEQQLIVMRNLVNGKPKDKKTENVFPRIYELLFSLADDVRQKKQTVEISVEIRSICRDIAVITDTQNKVITLSKRSAGKRDLKKTIRTNNNNNNDNR